MASRDPKDLHPALQKLWLELEAMVESQSPSTNLILTCTHRSPEEQKALYAQGRSKPGKIVTKAKPMQSLHNFNPALAFDVAPVRNGKCVWDVTDPVWPFIGKCCKKLGLDWGGSWKSFKDYPHIQMTKSMALELKNVDTKAILLLK